MSACHQLRVQSQPDPRNPVKFQQMCSCGLCTTYSLEKDNVDECHLPCAEKYVQPWDMMSSFCACDATTKWCSMTRGKISRQLFQKKKDPQNRPRILLHTYILKTNVTCGQINKTKQEIDRNYLGTGHRPPIPSSTTPKEEAGAGAVHLVRLGSGWSCNMSAAWKRKDERIRE